MTVKDLSYYASAAREIVRKDNPRDEIYAKIDEAAASEFTNPDELRALEWIKDRKFVSTAPADALNAAIRTFAARLPQLEIQPLSQDPREYDRAERLETAMGWEFTRMNRMGKKSTHWKIVEYAMRYCAVGIEVVYLPYAYQGMGKSPRVQEILRSRSFKWNVHNPSNIHVRESDDTLECVVNTQVKTLQELIDMFGYAKMAEQIKLVGERDLNSVYYSLYDYTDWDARVKWIAPNDGAAFLNRDVPEGFEIMREARTVSFLPWVFVDNEEPLLKQMVQAGLWDNVNILRTMQFSKAVDMAAHPEYWIQTPDGTLRNVHIDGTNPNQPLVTGPGINVNKLQPPSIDPNLATMTGTAESEVFRTTVAQILASVEKYASTQNFSVVNAMLNAAIAQLSLSQQTAERAETLATIMNFRWIKETEIPLVAFREKAKGEKKPRGQEITIKKNDFDLDYLYLQMKLEPATIMDKQTDINNAINLVDRLGMSKKMAWDQLKLEGYEVSEDQRGDEMLFESLITAEATKNIEMARAEAQMAVQSAAQAQAQGGEQTQFAAQAGMDTRGGGAPATSAGQGREQLNGKAASGQEIA